MSEDDLCVSPPGLLQAVFFLKKKDKIDGLLKCNMTHFMHHILTYNMLYNSQGYYAAGSVINFGRWLLCPVVDHAHRDQPVIPHWGQILGGVELVALNSAAPFLYVLTCSCMRRSLVLNRLAASVPDSCRNLCKRT